MRIVIAAGACALLMSVSVRAGELLPPHRSPAFPAVAEKLGLAPLTRQAIEMFDATEASNRNYDLVTCLDGLTFGFGHFYQRKIHGFFDAMRRKADGRAYRAFVQRSLEVFEADPAAWRAFVTKTGISDGARPDPKLIEAGFERTVLDSGYMKRYGRYPVRMRSATDCVPRGAGTRSFFDDHGAWFRPIAVVALRDSDVVAFQVRYWEDDYLDKGGASARKLGLPEAGAILITFILSNPKKVRNPARDALMRGGPIDTLSIAGRRWNWSGVGRPSQAAGATLDAWRLLLVWQAMCDGTDEIRSRNRVFFDKYLRRTFVLPAPKRPKDTALNCDPRNIRKA